MPILSDYRVTSLSEFHIYLFGKSHYNYIFFVGESWQLFEIFLYQYFGRILSIPFLRENALTVFNTPDIGKMVKMGIIHTVDI